jgi:hypothetical protein
MEAEQRQAWYAGVIENIRRVATTDPEGTPNPEGSIEAIEALRDEWRANGDVEAAVEEYEREPIVSVQAMPDQSFVLVFVRGIAGRWEDTTFPLTADAARALSEELFAAANHSDA